MENIESQSQIPSEEEQAIIKKYNLTNTEWLRYRLTGELPQTNERQENINTTEQIKESFDYLDYIEKRNFGEYKKAALDIVKFLNDPEFNVGDDYKIRVEKIPFVGVDEGFEIKQVPFNREKVFNAFCALCLKARVEVPPLEKDLINLGINPVRPDYSKIELQLGLTEQAPSRLTTLLIVDDHLDEIINSMLRIAGWPDVDIQCYLHKRKKHTKEMKKDQILSEAAESILSRLADIVLMDQDLDNVFQGNELVHQLKESPEGRKVKYVANTGSYDVPLYREGAYHNFNKGEDVEGLRKALLDIK